MTYEEFEEIMESDFSYNKTNDCRIFLGLCIIREFLPTAGIEAASHDIVFSVGIDELLKAGITKEKAGDLHRLGWMIDEDSLAHFA